MSENSYSYSLCNNVFQYVFIYIYNVVTIYRIIFQSHLKMLFVLFCSIAYFKWCNVRNYICMSGKKLFLLFLLLLLSKYVFLFLFSCKNERKNCMNTKIYIAKSAFKSFSQKKTQAKLWSLGTWIRSFAIKWNISVVQFIPMNILKHLDKEKQNENTYILYILSYFAKMLFFLIF